MNRRRSLEGDASAPSLKPYLAVVALIVMMGVVALAVVERWSPRGSIEDDLSPGEVENGGRVVIGPRSRTSKESDPSSADHIYKPEEFTFYKSLGNESTPEPNLAPALPRSSTQEVAPEQDLFAPATQGKAQPRRYTVQVGSFRDKKSADSLAARLKRRYQAVAVNRVTLPDKGVRYRVRVGEFKNRQDALTLAKTLKAKDRLNPFVASLTEGS